ncbi:MAG: hypothetical protein ACK4OO_07915 [bacterium]
MDDKVYGFPPGFKWGTAISTEQTAGFHPRSDWYAWERVPGHIKDGSVSGSRFTGKFPIILGWGNIKATLSFRLRWTLLGFSW